MEPFALLNLLQSLFKDAPPASTTPLEEFSSPLPTEEKDKSQENEVIPPSAQEAALRFLSEHDNRAKRNKKP